MKQEISDIWMYPLPKSPGYSCWFQCFLFLKSFSVKFPTDLCSTLFCLFIIASSMHISWCLWKPSFNSHCVTHLVPAHSPSSAWSLTNFLQVHTNVSSSSLGNISRLLHPNIHVDMKARETIILDTCMTRYVSKSRPLEAHFCLMGTGAGGQTNPFLILAKVSWNKPIPWSQVASCT